jgi:hypothetical protein
MRTMKPLLFLFALSFIAIACSMKNSQDHHEASGKEWKEMDDFHMVMADAFHPYMDSSNLEPARQNASELVTSAKRWRDAPLPARVNNDEFKAKLNVLVDLASTLEADIKEGNDEKTGHALTTLHDAFHDIQNEWYGASADNHDHEHDHEH